MPRHRVIKPEFFTSGPVADCSPTARLLFIGLWCFCDDGGVHPASPIRLKMEVFPADACSDDDVSKWIEELIGAGLVETYVVSGKQFWRVVGWHHQKIEKPTYCHPRSKEFGELAASIRRGLADESAAERKGAEGSEGEAKGEERRFMGDRKTVGKLPARASGNEDLPPRSSLPPINASRKAGEPIDLSNLDWGHVTAMAEKIAAKGIRPLTKDDRRLWFRFAILSELTFGEHWLMDSIEAVLRAKGTRKSRQAHFIGVAKTKAAEEHGIDKATFDAMLGRIEIPSSVWKSGVLEIRERAT